MRKLYYLIFICLMTLNNACADKPYITLLATTSVDNSGFLDYILPLFEKDHGIAVRSVIAGSGASLQSGRKGNGDVLLTHSLKDEIQFINEGWGESRLDLMYNDFVLVGPRDDPAGVSGADSIFEALQLIARKPSRFISRSDNSGTDRREQSLWRGAGIDPVIYSGEWYLQTGVGMGMTLNIAVSSGGYTLSDRATWLAFGNKQSHGVVFSGGDELVNQYALLAVSSERHSHVKSGLVGVFVGWMLSGRGRDFISGFRVGGEQLFFANDR